MTSVREEWLEKVVEEPLDPTWPICDPHHHLWDRPNDRYFQQMSTPGPHVTDYRLDDVLRDIAGGHNITHTVFVECTSMYKVDGPEEMRPVGETEYVQGVVAANWQRCKTDVAAGIVGFADLTLGAAVNPVLEAHIQVGKGRLRGIRHSCAWDASPEIRGYKNPPQGLMRDQHFRQGLAQLQELGLSFEAWHYHTQFAELVELARGFPDLPIILNHVGGPLGTGPYAGNRQEVFQVWRRGIVELATCPNVVVKLGGLGMVSMGFGWHERPQPPSSEELAEAWAPYYLLCIEMFGPNRCMFESNFPVDKVSCSYTVLWNAFKRISANFSPVERAALFRNTAARTYRLDIIDTEK